MKTNMNFRWDLNEHNFKRMMREEQTPDVFGSVRFGEYLVEFRCTGGGYDDDYHLPTTDVYHYGESGIEDFHLADGTPYKILDTEFKVPRRRSLAGFIKAFEDEVLSDLFTSETDIDLRLALAPTLSHADWNPKPMDETELRVPTMIGDIVVKDKGYGKTSGYPGVYVGLERNGKLFEVAMIECDQEFDEDEGPLLKCHVYCADPAHDDPIYDYTTDTAKIDSFLSEY